MYSLIKNTYTSQKCSAATRCSPWHTYKNKLANASLLFALIFINQFVIAQSSISGNQDFKLLNEGDFKPANSKNINIQATINENSFNNFALSSDKIDGLRANSFGTATSDLITNNRLVCPIITHNAFTNFNSSNPSNVATTLWVNIHTKLTGQLSSNGDFLLFTSGNIQLTSITATWSSAVITDGKIIADNSVSVPTTSFDIPNNIWITKVPLGYSSSDIFITGAAIISTTGYEVSSGKQSEISGNFYSNVTFSSSWFYGSAAYQPAFTLTDIAGAGIVSSIGDGIKAGTPTNQQAYLVPGGSGGGASNYTGSYSSVDDFTACLGAPTCSNVTQGGTVGTDQTFCSSGNPVAFTSSVAASGGTGTLEYQWQSSPDNSTWSDISGATADTYDAPSISATTYYRRAARRSGCSPYAFYSNVITVTINAIPAVPAGANNSRCGTGTVTLSASGCVGTYNWYAASTSGASLSTTATYTTPSISATTTYYVDCTVGSCPSTKVATTATINAIPLVPSGSNNSRCGPGTVILTGSGCSGTYNWYAASTGGASLSTTTSYTTPSISTTTTYYVDCTVNGCASASRDPAIATINIIPVPVGANNSRCSTGTVTLSASGCAGTYNWYAASTGGASLSAKATYTTPSISTTTTYYVDCTVNACVSSRDPAIATINAIPAAPTTTPGSRCGPGTVVLSNNCAGTSNWFSALTGGTSLGTGTTFTTPSIISNTTYYADCSVNGCLSTSRASALATVLTPPTATASNSGVHCLGTTFKLIGGGDGVSFSWSGPDSFTSTSQSPLVPSASADMAGVYTLTVTASNGCTTTATTNLVINTNCNSICTSVISVVPTNPTGCSATDGSIFISEYSGGPFYENSIDGITWYNSEKTYSNLGVGYHTIFIRDKTSQIICRTVSATLTAITTAYYTGETVTNATSCTGTNGSITLQGVVGTDKVSWISSTNRTYVAVSTLSPTNTISNLAAGQYYVIVTRGGNPLFCYSERMVTIANSGTPCTAGLCTASGSSNLFPNGDFGSGSSKIGTPLLSSETQYSFAPMNCDSPNDGNYTITNTSDCNGATAGGNIFGTWDILTQDHTTGDTDGYMMIVNASFNPDIVIEKTITNLCPNTKYEYSLWIYNLCPPTNTSGCPIKPNLTFLIDGVGKYNTGTLNTSGWQQVGFTFSTGNSTSSTFSIRNNALGGLGNDWVIDDISITQCLPTINQSASASKCIGTTAQTVSATVTDVNQQYQYYKWQESTDNGSTWADLTSATLASFSSNTYTVSYNLPSPITLALNGRKYRIIVGTSTANLANSSCSFLSTGTTIIVPTIAVTTSTTQTICLGSSASITANATGGTSPYTYTWNNGVGTGSPKSVSPSSTTTYTVTVTDANACSATATTQVIVSTLPSAPAPSNNSRCGTGTVALLASGCSGGTINWYASATGGTGLTTGTNYTTPSISATTIYYLECTVNGCTSASRSSVVATVNPIPTVSLSNQTICSGQTISLTPTGLSNASTYSWNTGAAISSISVSPTTTESYTLTVSSAPGCTATASASVTVNPQPTVGMSNQMVCQNTVLTLTPTITSGSSFLWNTGATTSTLGVPTSTVGTINYTITVTGSTGGCTATASASVTVNALPTTTLSAPTICAGESTTLTPTGLSNATVFSWSTGATTSTINVSPSVTTLYTLIVSSAVSCSITKSVLVEVNPIPTANVIVVNSACLGSVSRNNGMLILNRYRNTDTVAYGSPISASPIFNNVPVGGVFSNNLPNTNTTYTIRVKNIYGCTSNITAQTTPVVCACPAGYCEPVIVIKTK